MAILKNTTISDTGSINLPVGTTAQRPASPAGGQIRYNTDINDTEYYDGAAWRPISDSNPEATGGTIVDTDIGGVPYRLHTFTATGNSTFTVSKGGEVEYLVVAGGGGGGGTGAGGAGAGGLLTGTTTVTAQAYAITVGTGGAAGRSWNNTPSAGTNGGNSSAFGLTAIGGGRTARFGGGAAGGSGGGGDRNVAPGQGTAGQGNAGGSSPFANGEGTGGGGGAGSLGQDAVTVDIAGNGGVGLVLSLSGISSFYAGGGGGGIYGTSRTPGRGGLGGGGAGGNTNVANIQTGARDAAPNTGGGGGGGGYTSSGPDFQGGGNGGSGIVVIRYRRNATTTNTSDATKISSVPSFYSPAITDTTSLISTDGLQVNLDAFDPNSYSGGTTWTDLTGGGNNVTLVNSPTHFSTQGYVSFDGTTQQGNTVVPTFNSGSQAYTFEVLFRMRTLPTAEYAANGHIWGGRMGDHIVLYVNPAVNGRSTLNMNHDDARYSVTGAFTNSTIGANEWVHWIVSWSVPAYRYTHYINGTIDRQGGTTLSGQESKPWPTPGAVAYDSRWNTYSTLDIAVMRQYNRVLGFDEVLKNFNAVRGRFGV